MRVAVLASCQATPSTRALLAPAFRAPPRQGVIIRGPSAVRGRRRWRGPAGVRATQPGPRARARRPRLHRFPRRRRPPRLMPTRLLPCIDTTLVRADQLAPSSDCCPE